MLSFKIHGPFLLVDKMQDADRTIHKKHNGCSVAAERPESFSAFLGTTDKSHIQTIQHFRKKKNVKLSHSSTALNYNATNFYGGSEVYRKKKHLLDFVEGKEAKFYS